MNCNEQTLRKTIAEHGGVIAAGSHVDEYDNPHCPLCILEMQAACEVALGIRDEITDNPTQLGRPDYRPINDAFKNDRTRTEQMLRLHLAYEGWADWSDQRKRRIDELIVIWTVSRIIAELPDLPDNVRQLCRDANSLSTAAYATRDAAFATYADATFAAYYNAAKAVRAADAIGASELAAKAARTAAFAAGAAAADEILIEAVNIWCEAAALATD